MMRVNGKKFFNRNALMERWQCSSNSITNWVKNDSIPYIRTPGGRILLFPVDAILEYEQNQRKNGKEVNKKPRKKRRALSTPKKIWRVE